MSDEQKICIGCGNSFDFTEGEQQYYKERGLFPPKRCKACRIKKNQEKQRSASENYQQ